MGNIVKGNIPQRVKGFPRDLLRITGLYKCNNQLEKHHLESEEHFLENLREMETARGYFEQLEYQGGRLTISGWMLHPKRDFNSFAVYINQHKVEEAMTKERQDVAKVYPFISHAKNSGFFFNLHSDLKEMGGTIDICIVGIAEGREIAKIETWYRTDIYSSLPAPPPHLTLRVTGCEVPSVFLTSGMQIYRDFWTTVCKYKDPLSIKSMLDWGCGCGRITGFFLKFSKIPQICGCDIDVEAIAWCQDNLKPAEFSVVRPHPPTAYADHAFDLIISLSVFTHLSREVQFLWLREMQRILAPGGLFVATVHGEFATLLKFPGKDIKEFLKDGIYDVLEDGSLEGIAPGGYYRAVFQTNEYTLKEWSRYFEILEYKEGGVGHNQDVVVMMRRDPKRDGSR